jgi:membrane protease YdiL (CAAX protease family)
VIVMNAEIAADPDSAPPAGVATGDIATPDVLSRPRIRAEVLIVLGLSLGQSAVYAIVELVKRYLATAPIGKQTTTLNPSLSTINYLNIVLQVLNIIFTLVPVALALYLLSSHGQSWKTRLGLDLNGRSRWRDVGLGFGLAAAIGLPGLGLYAVGRAIGQTVRIDTSGLPHQWWSAVILLASAGVAGMLEEVIVVGYLITRLQEMRWSVPVAILASALLRGSYHLYQGWPMAIGNAVMGAVFGWVFVRTGRLGPLILAHWTLDAVSFIGPDVVPASWIAALNGG